MARATFSLNGDLFNDFNVGVGSGFIKWTAVEKAKDQNWDGRPA